MILKLIIFAFYACHAKAYGNGYLKQEPEKKDYKPETREEMLGVPQDEITNVIEKQTEQKPLNNQDT